jgi:hypothetical protein
MNYRAFEETEENIAKLKKEKVYNKKRLHSSLGCIRPR